MTVPTPPSTIIRLDTITPQPLRWLWRPRIPHGRLSILVGHPDRGKSVLVCTCAAIVSRGARWPDDGDCQGGNVILLEAEDSLSETIVPRLMAAGAELSKILTSTSRNLKNLPGLIHDYQPQLVIVSPLNTYLPGLNTWNDQEVRHALQPLADIAEASKVALLGIMHPPKAKQNLPVHAIGGSMAFGAIARSVLTVDRGEDGLHLLEASKGNLARWVPPIGYRIRSWEHDTDVAQLVWEVVPETLSFTPADDERGALVEACDFIRMTMNSGGISSRDLKLGADKNGISWRTIMRARKILRIQSHKVFLGKKSHWFLSLPVSSIVKDAKPS